MRVSIQNISKSFGANDIARDFSLEVYSGTKLCICGYNGSGKSTFIKMLAGEEPLDAGRITFPKGCRVGYVQQELLLDQLDTPLLEFVLDVLPDWDDFWKDWEKAVAEKNQERIAELGAKQAQLELQYGYNPEHLAKIVLSGLGFATNKWSLPLKQLSGGWRERAKLARVLTAGADVLLLDEPTNHLDLEAVNWLEAYLLDYKGILIFVAHDRVFMDKIGTSVLHFSGNGRPMFRKCGYSQFLKIMEETEDIRAREAARVQDEIEKKMDFVKRFGAKASKARQASSRQKMVKKLEKELEGMAPESKAISLEFSWPKPTPSERTVVAVTGLEFSFSDGKRLWNSLDFSIYRGQKIALVGSNGSGKSTLLKLLTGKAEKNKGDVSYGQQVKLGYFSQHQLDILNSEGTVLSEIRRLSDPRTTEEELMSVLGLFLLGQKYFERKVSLLSGGEKSRLILATLFLGKYNFLVLDEPTNHLDLESREALVEALQSYEGTILMVAHDRFLLSEVANQIWHLDHGIEVYNDFEAYVDAQKQKSMTEINLEENKDTNKRQSLSREESKRIKREQAELRQKLYKEIKPVQEKYAKTEKELEELLNKQKELETLLSNPLEFQDGGRATQLLKDFHSLQEKSEELFLELSTLEEKLLDLEQQKTDLDALN